MNNRRQFLKRSMGVSVFVVMPLSSCSKSENTDFEIKVEYKTESWLDSKVDTFSYSMPEIELIQNKKTRIKVTNNLNEPTTIHWHGIRLENKMDGVSGLIQAPIEPGESFIYEFSAPDAGTFWFHSHHDSIKQVAMGLYGALIVKPEKSLNNSEQDLTLLIDDWLLNENGIDPNFTAMHSLSHGGIMGNVLTVNKQPGLQAFQIEDKQYLRLRLINVANSRIQSWSFSGLNPIVIAKDGQPLKDQYTLNKSLVLGPAERYDLLVKVKEIPEDGFKLNYDTANGALPIAEFILPKVKTDFKNEAYNIEKSVLVVPKKIDKTVVVELDGGAMGRMQTGILDGEKLSINQLVQKNMIWALNGQVALLATPMDKLELNAAVNITFKNNTSFAHNMHLHGHHFFIDGIWQDSVLIGRGESKSGVFYADNPGKWLLHCHMLGHAVTGMTTWFEIG
ncbi:multicopper oxidase family protein [Marinicellulosiphila megalodicopiae]|uniref:multicopper oxidase family protein n=1 Tax=Marinicellulosiphila megalodicopiae TaxID=2724896 RepID=UPI003BB1BC03